LQSGFKISPFYHLFPRKDVGEFLKFKNLKTTFTLVYFNSKRRSKMKKLFVVTLVLGTIMINLTQLSFAQTSALKSNNTNFLAEYDRLLDYYTHDFNVHHSAFSGDGKKFFIYGKNSSSDPVLYLLDANDSDGSNMNSISFPAEREGVKDVTINQDGSRAFFLDHGRDYIYKVEDGSAIEILHRTNYSGVGNIYNLETTAEGDYVYFRDGREIWRIGHNGGAPELLIKDENVQRIEGTGRDFGELVVSADGNIIGFVVKQYKDSENHLKRKHEVLVYNRGTITQITNDTEHVYKEHLDMSGDGSTIVFSAGSDVDKYYSIKSDGTNKTEIENLHSNFAGLSLTYDGSKVLYNDGGGRGGRLLNTDGSGGMDIFPRTGAGNIAISMYDNLYISDDGARISFRYQIRTFPSRYALYVGYLNDVSGVSDAPVIESINFDPPSMPTNDADATIKLLAKINDPNGLENIQYVSATEIIDGKKEQPSSEVPVYFYQNPKDNGNPPDQTAGDGIYTTIGEPGGKIHETNQMIVRVGAMDESKTVVVKDVILNIGGSTGIETKNNLTSGYELFQNYPNPFNPETTIKYSIPKSTITHDAKLIVYNVLGEKVRTLINSKQKSGNYSVQWDGLTDSGKQAHSGLYWYQLHVGSFIEIKKMLKIK